MVVVHRHIGGLAVLDLAGLPYKGIPDGWPLPVLVPGTLDLVGRRDGAPGKAFREFKVGHDIPR